MEFSICLWIHNYFSLNLPQLYCNPNFAIEMCMSPALTFINVRHLSPKQIFLMNTGMGPSCFPVLHAPVVLKIRLFWTFVTFWHMLFVCFSVGQNTFLKILFLFWKYKIVLYFVFSKYFFQYFILYFLNIFQIYFPNCKILLQNTFSKYFC